MRCRSRRRRTLTGIEAALTEVTSQIQEDQFTRLMSEVSRERGRLSQLLIREGGFEGATAAISGNSVSHQPTVSAGSERLPRYGIRRRRAATRRRRFTGWHGRDGQTIREDDFELAGSGCRGTAHDVRCPCRCFLTKDEREPRARLATKSVINALPDADDILRPRPGALAMPR